MTAIDRMFAILDEIDAKGTIRAKDLIDEDNTHSTVYRHLKALYGAGLLSRVGYGVYGPGPRYNKQRPGTKFDEEYRSKELFMKARELIVEGLDDKEAAKELGISYQRFRKLFSGDE